MHHLYDLIAAGTLSASLKAFFFIFSFDEMIEKDKKEIDAEVDQKMKNFKNTNNPRILRKTLRWLEYDKFSNELKKDFIGQSYINELIKLKNSYLDFYQSYLEEVIKDDSGIIQVADLVSKNDDFILRIARMRMIIDPKIQLSQNVHKQTNILYMKVKGYWITDDGVKVRKFFKSLGRFDLYPNGIKDENAIMEGRNKIREAMIAEYSKTV